MKPLIDADVLLHEIGWSGEFKDKETGEDVLLDPDRVFDILDDKISGICLDVDATESPILFVSDSPEVTRMINRLGKYTGVERSFVPNFRYDIAKTKPYKGHRNNPKPFHFYNILAYMLAEYEVVISENGLEADDMLSIYQCSHDNTVICSRDKDLRICPGNHFSWECGQQRSIGPTSTDRIGWLEMHEKVVGKTKTGKPKFERKVVGYGLSFFYYQMLVGDSADNIPGLKGWGQAHAYELLKDFNSEKGLYKTVKEEYKKIAGDKAKDLFLEQANLLWIWQEKDTGYKFPVTN